MVSEEASILFLLPCSPGSYTWQECLGPNSRQMASKRIRGPETAMKRKSGQENYMFSLLLPWELRGEN